MRAAILSAMMSLMPVAPVNLLRYLNVPAIVLTLRAERGRRCRDRACASRSRAWRKRG